MKKRVAGAAVAAVTVAAVLWSATAAAHRALPSPRYLIRQSLLAAVQARSVHVSGRGVLAESTREDGVRSTLSVRAYVSGDVAEQNGEAAAHLTGFALSHHYRLRLVGRQAAYKVAKKPWECIPVGAVVVPPSYSLAAKRIWRLIRRHARSRTVGLTTRASRVLWHVVATSQVKIAAVGRLIANATALPLGSSTVSSTAGRVRLRVGLWIDRGNMRLRRLTLRATAKHEKSVVRASFSAAFSRYGHTKAIALPGTCE